MAGKSVYLSVKTIAAIRFAREQVRAIVENPAMPDDALADADRAIGELDRLLRRLGVPVVVPGEGDDDTG